MNIVRASERKINADLKEKKLDTFEKNQFNFFNGNLVR
jgi:hypothetical protein